jgi:branched-chain amino acid aminotransferase
MSEYTYHVDGDLVPAAEATVNVQDRGFKYGDAAFETIRAYGGTPFEWEAHVERLARTCELLGFEEEVPQCEDLRTRVDETLAANDLEDAYVRLSVTRGVQSGKLTPSQDVDPTVVVIVSDLPRGGVDGERVWSDSVVLELVETVRAPESVLLSKAKTHNYLQGIIARLELRGQDADEALLASPDGFLAEGATSNVFVVSDGTLKTPATDLPILPGITRSVVLDLAKAADIPVETGHYEPESVEKADEAFLTNSTWEIRPIGRVGDHRLESGPITEELQRRFDERVEALY